MKIEALAAMALRESAKLMKAGKISEVMVRLHPEARHPSVSISFRHGDQIVASELRADVIGMAAVGSDYVVRQRLGELADEIS